MGDACERRFRERPFLRGFRAHRFLPRLGGVGVPGEESVTQTARGRGAGRVGAACSVLVAGWALATAVVASSRHELHPPSRSAPDSGGNAFGFGFTPQDLHALLQAGHSDGLLPNGNRVALSLNEELQAQVFDLFRRFDPLYGVFAAMEPDTGRVVALVGYRRGGEADPWLPLKAIYPAASLVKVVTASATGGGSRRCPSRRRSPARPTPCSGT